MIEKKEEQDFIFEEAKKLIEEDIDVETKRETTIEDAIEDSEKPDGEEEVKKEETVEEKNPVVEKEHRLNLSRQAAMVSEKDVNKFSLKIFGVGSIGSHTTKLLGKTGFKDIEIFDMDVVEQGNISAQAFDFKHIGMKKVDAMKDIMKESCGLNITTNHGEIKEESDISPEPDTIYCCFFDSIEARRMLFDKLKGFPVMFIDTRIGKYHMKYYFVMCDNEDDIRAYEKTLGITAAQLECGEKACAPVNMQLSGMVTMNILSYISGDEYIKKMEGNAASPQLNMFSKGE